MISLRDVTRQGVHLGTTFLIPAFASSIYSNTQVTVIHWRVFDFLFLGSCLYLYFEDIYDLFFL
jgi:hypothetical protein